MALGIRHLLEQGRRFLMGILIQWLFSMKSPPLFSSFLIVSKMSFQQNEKSVLPSSASAFILNPESFSSVAAFIIDVSSPDPGLVFVQ